MGEEAGCIVCGRKVSHSRADYSPHRCADKNELEMLLEKFQPEFEQMVPSLCDALNAATSALTPHWLPNITLADPHTTFR
eukprot:gene10230-biopygen4919